MMTEATNTLNYYVLLYKTKYGKAPAINRYRDKWGFLDVITDYGVDRARELLDFYFKLQRHHDVKGFFLSYDDLDESERQIAKDRAAREKIREETRRRVEQSE